MVVNVIKYFVFEDIKGVFLLKMLVGDFIGIMVFIEFYVGLLFVDICILVRL